MLGCDSLPDPEFAVRVISVGVAGHICPQRGVEVVLAEIQALLAGAGHRYQGES